MRLDGLSNRRVVLLGLGTDVRATVWAIVAAGPAELVVVDDGLDAGESVDVGLVAAGSVSAGTGGGGPVDAVDLAEAAAWGEVFVRSPGFPRYQPVLLAALERGSSMTTPLDLWMGTYGAGRTVVGITGTKGKSTVTDLVGDLAGRAGVRVGVAGNLGVPVFDGGWDHAAPVVVLEVSSYQAADLHHVPDIAVVTSLAEDHLSWHGGLDRYVADKLRLVRNEGGSAGRVLVPVEGGRATAALASLGIEADVVAAPVGSEGPASVPRHRLQNAALAAEVLHHIGGPQLSGDEVIDAARTSLPGRLDPCPGPQGVLCLDDALASNPSATAAGLAWVRSMDRPTVVLLGGADRGVDPSPLTHEVAQWADGRLLAVELPDNGPDLARRCGITSIGACAVMDDAVRTASAALFGDGVVIFSPGAPTPPGSGTWATRSNGFRSALAALR